MEVMEVAVLGYRCAWTWSFMCSRLDLNVVVCNVLCWPDAGSEIPMSSDGAGHPWYSGGRELFVYNPGMLGSYRHSGSLPSHFNYTITIQKCAMGICIPLCCLHAGRVLGPGLTNYQEKATDNRAVAVSSTAIAA